MTYPAEAIAKYIIWHEWEAKRPVSNLRLQNLLYFAQAYFILLNDNPLFDDDMEAWDCGPVVPSVYETYKKYGSMIIQDVSEQADGLVDGKDKAILDRFLESSSNKTNSELGQIARGQEPYKLGTMFQWHRKIPVSAMESYFRFKREENNLKIILDTIKNM